MKKVLVLGLSLILAACAHNSTQSQVATKPQTVAKPVEEPPINKTVYDLMGRFEQQQKELQQLRGQIEEQSYTIADLKKRQHAILSDFDQRLQSIEAASTTDPGFKIDSTTKLQQNMPEEAIPPSEDTRSAKVTGIEKQVYLAAYENLRNGHTNQAIEMLNQVIVDYPNGEYADNAQYWLGEAYKVKKDTRAAKAAFGKVINNYPESDKVPDAMLKLAYIELEESDISTGRSLLLKIIDEHRDSTAARLAETKLMQLDGGSF